MVLRKETRVKGIFYSLFAAACSLALLAFYRLNPLVVLHSYFSAAGRGVPTLERFAAAQALLMAVWQVATPVVMIAPLIALLAGRILARKPWQVDTPCSIVLVGGILAGAIGCFTNGEMRITDTTMVTTCTALFCLLTAVDRNDPTNRLPIFLQRLAITFSVLVGLWMTVTRYRVETIGPFFEPGANITVGDRNVFFSKLKCGPIMIGILEDISKFLSNAQSKLNSDPKLVFDPESAALTLERQPKLFFGPRMTWGYAAFNSEPPRGLPLSWWAGVDYPPDQLTSIAADFKHACFDYLICYAPTSNSMDATYLPKEIIDIIVSDYSVCARGRFVVILARKTQVK